MRLIFPVLLAAGSLTGCDSATPPEVTARPPAAAPDTTVIYREDKAAINPEEGLNDLEVGTSNTVILTLQKNRKKLVPITLPEIRTADVVVRRSRVLQVYSVAEKVLFTTNDADIKGSGATALREIAASLRQRYPKNNVVITGFAAARYAPGFNRGLANRRATAIKHYLQEVCHMSSMFVYAEIIDETLSAPTTPVATGTGQTPSADIVVLTQ